MTDCMFCGKPTDHDGTAHWRCGGILPDDPRHTAISVADHIVRLLTPMRTLDAFGKIKRATVPALTAQELLAKLRPELAGHLDAGIALALDAGAVSQAESGRYQLAPLHRRSQPAHNEPGLFDLGGVP